MSFTNGIGNLQQTVGTAATEAAKPVAGGVAKAGAGQAVSQQADHAELSATGSLISKGLDGSDVRMEKVQALQQAIASGSYQVSSSEVAGKLIDSMME